MGSLWTCRETVASIEQIFNPCLRVDIIHDRPRSQLYVVLAFPASTTAALHSAILLRDT